MAELADGDQTPTRRASTAPGKSAFLTGAI